MSGLSTKESEDNEDIWTHRCMNCIRCNEPNSCGTCWPCKLGKTCEKRRCFSAKKMYNESVKKMADLNLAAIKAKTAVREAAASSSASGPMVLPSTSMTFGGGPSTSSSGAYVPSFSAAPEKEKKKRGRKKKSELAAAAAAAAQKDRRINEMDYVPHRPTRQQLADLRRKRTTVNEFQSVTVTEPRQCLQPDCLSEARPESKYCSDRCGKILAKMRLTEVLPQRVKEYFGPGPAGPRTFEQDIQDRKVIVEADMQRLNDSEKSLMRFIEKLHAFVEKQIPLPPLGITEKDDENLYEGCVICGLHDIPLRKYVKHIELCWSRSEKAMSFGGPEKAISFSGTDNNTIYCEKYDSRAGTYCKRLKSLCPEHRKPGIEHTLKVCGYPKRWEEAGRNVATSNTISELIEMEDPFGDEGCRTKRDVCHKHHKWVPSLRGSIELEMSALYQQMLELIQKTHKLKTREKWSTNVLSILMHKEAVITDPELFQQHLRDLKGEPSEQQPGGGAPSQEPEEPESSSTQTSGSTQASDDMFDTAGFLAAMARQKDHDQAALEEARRAMDAMDEDDVDIDVGAEEGRRLEEEEEDVGHDSEDDGAPGPSYRIHRRA